jgi:hypothetical protein
MDSIGKISLINPFATILLFYDNVQGDALAEIVHDKPGKDFLLCGRVLLRVQVG